MRSYMHQVQKDANHNTIYGTMSHTDKYEHEHTNVYKQVTNNVVVLVAKRDITTTYISGKKHTVIYRCAVYVRGVCVIVARHL